MAKYINAELFLQTNAEIANCEILHPKCFDTLKELIDKAPTADVRENVKGKWILEEGGVFRCSFCGERYYLVDDAKLCDYNYCPNCGADMRSNENGNTQSV